MTSGETSSAWKRKAKVPQRPHGTVGQCSSVLDFGAGDAIRVAKAGGKENLEGLTAHACHTQRLLGRLAENDFVPRCLTGFVICGTSRYDGNL